MNKMKTDRKDKTRQKINRDNFKLVGLIKLINPFRKNFFIYFLSDL